MSPNNSQSGQDSDTLAIPPAIRILPMNRKAEFPHCKTVEELQLKFFLGELPKRPNGTYRYHAGGLRSKSGTLVLFQSDGFIIAHATLMGTERFPKPDSENYKGALYFDVNSIKAFEPLDLTAISDIWPKVKSFARWKYDLDPTKINEFTRKLKYIER